MPLKAGGEFALAREQVEKALGLSGQPVKRGSMAHEHDIYMSLADTAALVRDAAALRQYSARLQELAERDGHKLYLAIAHRAWGVAHRLAGEHAEAGKRLTGAMELFTNLGTRWQIARTLFEIADLERAQGEAGAAREHFSQALATFEEMKAAPDVERTRAALGTIEGKAEAKTSK